MAILAVFLAGCAPSGIYLIPQSPEVSPVTQEVGAVYRLTENEAPGGNPAVVSLTSHGIARAVLQDGQRVALMHVQFAFRNRTGLNVTFKAETVKVVAPPMLVQPVEPAWIYPGEPRPMPDLIPSDKDAIYDLYFILGYPDVMSNLDSVSVTWEYTLGDMLYGTTTVFFRGAGLPSQRYGYETMVTYPADTVYVDSPIHIWWWWPLFIGGGGGHHGGHWSGPGPTPGPSFHRR
jgi:hypothetical protein